MDPAHAVFWVCGWPEQHARLSDAVEDDVHYWPADDWELAQGEAVRLALVSVFV